MAANTAENNYRTFLRRAFASAMIGAQVEAVAWVRRQSDEFAAIVISTERPEEYDRVLDLLTSPRCPLRVVREFTGRYDIRIYVEIA
jgi:hypothetical protein